MKVMEKYSSKDEGILFFLLYYSFKNPQNEMGFTIYLEENEFFYSRAICYHLIYITI
jgi:hypothetical protein